MDLDQGHTENFVKQRFLCWFYKKYLQACR